MSKYDTGVGDEFPVEADMDDFEDELDEICDCGPVDGTVVVLAAVPVPIPLMMLGGYYGRQYRKAMRRRRRAERCRRRYEAWAAHQRQCREAEVVEPVEETPPATDTDQPRPEASS